MNGPAHQSFDKLRTSGKNAQDSRKYKLSKNGVESGRPSLFEARLTIFVDLQVINFTGPKKLFLVSPSKDERARSRSLRQAQDGREYKLTANGGEGDRTPLFEFHYRTAH